MGTTEPRAVVIGAGPAGLAAGAELGRAGIPAIVLDRTGAVGSSWRGRYDRLRLNTSRWTSKLPGARYPRGTPLFPTRDQVVDYLERYVRDNELNLELGTEVERIDRDDGRWIVRSSAGDLRAEHVVVATGLEHTPFIPDWRGRDRFGGELLHTAEYRNPDRFAGKDVLVVGPGCSGMEIAYDLATGGAARVRVAVRTPPTILLRQSGPMPGDVPARMMLRLPPRLADRLAPQVKLAEYGLGKPDDGPMVRLLREEKVPTIVDKQVVKAIKDRQIEVVAAVESLDRTGAILANGSHADCDVIIAATGYRSGLEPMVGHLDVLNERGIPRIHGGDEVLPGLRFIGYVPEPGQIGLVGREAKRVVRGIARAGVAA